MRSECYASSLVARRVALICSSCFALIMGIATAGTLCPTLRVARTRFTQFFALCQRPLKFSFMILRAPSKSTAWTASHGSSRGRVFSMTFFTVLLTSAQALSRFGVCKIRDQSIRRLRSSSTPFWRISEGHVPICRSRGSSSLFRSPSPSGMRASVTAWRSSAHLYSGLRSNCNIESDVVGCMIFHCLRSLQGTSAHREWVITIVSLHKLTLLGPGAIAFHPRLYACRSGVSCLPLRWTISRSMCHTYLCRRRCVSYNYWKWSTYVVSWQLVHEQCSSECQDVRGISDS
jgi:hypothetical protein